MTETRENPESRSEGRPDLRPARRRTIPAGHAILAMLVALGLGTLLNADSLMKTAEGLPFGSTKRTVAVGAMRPVHGLAELLRIDRPRERLDVALGHAPAPEEDPFAVPISAAGPDTTPTTTTTTTTPRPTRPGETTTTTTSTTSTATTTVPKRPQATKEKALRIWAAGDSLSAEFGKSLYRLGFATDEVWPLGSVDYHVSTGLSRPDYFNWPAEIAAKVKELDPQVVVLVLGSNDDQNMKDREGRTQTFGSEGWQQEYRRRVGAVMDQILAGERYVVWVGVPIMRNGDRNAHYQLINSIIRTEAAKATRKGRVWFVDSYKLFQDANGAYAQYLPNEKGELVEVRTGDGIHFQRAGADRLAHRTFEVMARPFRIDAYLPPK